MSALMKFYNPIYLQSFKLQLSKQILLNQFNQQKIVILLSNILISFIMQQQLPPIENIPLQQQKQPEQKQAPPTCQMFIVRKKRVCKFLAVTGSKYCAAHCSDLQDKIECPYEKGFFISAKKYQKHLKNCPKLQNLKKQENSQWFSKDINKKQENAQQPHSLQMPNLSLLEEGVLQIMVQRAIQLYLDNFQEDQRLHFIQSSPLQNLQNTTNDHVQATLITEKAFENKLVAPQFVYVEFGAGKGILSYAIALKIQNQFKTHSKNILLERQSRRNKFDKYFRDNPYFQRYKGDVANFDFKALPTTVAHTAVEKCRLKTLPQEIQKQICKLQLIGICKHMCGQALDISVRGLLQGNAKGCILASCCHHLCRYHTYLNPKFFEQQGLSPDQIQILFRMSSWGTKSHKFDPISQDIFTVLQGKGYKLLEPDQKILVGRMCKRLIDLGRAEYLQGKLYRYCSDQLTPQNYVIISKK